MEKYKNRQLANHFLSATVPITALGGRTGCHFRLAAAEAILKTRKSLYRYLEEDGNLDGVPLLKDDKFIQARAILVDILTRGFRVVSDELYDSRIKTAVPRTRGATWNEKDTDDASPLEENAIAKLEG